MNEIVCDRCSKHFTENLMLSIGNEMFCEPCYDEVCELYENLEESDKQ